MACAAAAWRVRFGGAPAHWGWGGCQEAWALQYFIGCPVSYDYKQEWVVALP